MQPAHRYNHKTLIVGLTGGIGSGKTAASDSFSRLGVPVVDADVIAREALQQGSPLLDEVIEHFGTNLLDASGQLERSALRAIIFEQPEAKHWLEDLIHPWVRQRIITALTHLEAPYAILSSPLLLETGQDQLVDRVLVVDVPPTLQIERVHQRDQNSPELIRKIIQQQIDRSSRIAAADDLLDNSGDLPHLARQIESLHQHYLELARKQ